MNADRYTVLVRIIAVTDPKPATGSGYNSTPATPASDTEVVSLTYRDTDLIRAIDKAARHLQFERPEPSTTTAGKALS